MKQESKFWIEKLNLEPHPEGGFFRETYRSKSTTQTTEGARSHSTAIYFLLEKGNFSAFHRIKSDELWHFYAGDSLSIYVLHKTGKLEVIHLGADASQNQLPQAVVPADTWFASRVAGNGTYSLVGCTVAPGFDFADFELAEREKLQRAFPAHAETIAALTR